MVQLNLIRSKKEFYDKEGNLLHTIRYEKSSTVENKYNMYIDLPNGRSYAIGLAETTPNGTVIIEKTLQAKNGFTTNYIYGEDKNGEKFVFTRFTDKNGNQICEHKYKYKVIDENHYKTNENGVEYDIKYFDDKVIVTRSNGEQVVVEIGENGNSVISRDLLPMLKQMPGSLYFDIDKYGLKQIGLGIDGVNPKNAHYNVPKNLITISSSLQNSLSTFIHEFGHYKAKHLKLTEDKDLFETFQRERDTFMLNQTGFESEEISYLITVENKIGELNYSLEEMLSDVHSLMYSSISWANIELRTQYLQEHFPETYAKIVKKFLETE